MSVTKREKSVIVSSLVGLVMLSSCSQSVTDKGCEDLTSTVYPQSNYQEQEIVYLDYDKQTQELNVPATSMNKWGPQCPLNGQRLDYLQSEQDTALTMPRPKTEVVGYVAEAVVISQQNPEAVMPVSKEIANRQLPPCAYSRCGCTQFGENRQQNMVPQAPQVPQQVMPQIQVQIQPNMVAPVQPTQVSQPIQPAPVSGYQNPTNQVIAVSQPTQDVSAPLEGVVAASNQNGFVFLECSGKYVSNNTTNCPPQSVSQPYVNNQQPLPTTVQKDANYTQDKANVVNKKASVDEDWVATEGSSLRSLLESWGDRAQWRVVWNSDREYIVEAGAVFRGKFMDVASALIRAFARANPAPQGTFYKGNKVLVINTQEAENAE